MIKKILFEKILFGFLLILLFCSLFTYLEKRNIENNMKECYNKNFSIAIMSNCNVVVECEALKAYYLEEYNKTKCSNNPFNRKPSCKLLEQLKNENKKN